MSIEERVTQLEQMGNELIKPDIHCVFCYPRPGGLKDSESHIAGYEFVLEKLMENGIVSCNHEKLGIESWWFADFVSGALLHEMISNHNRDQHELEPNRQVLSDYSIMANAFDTYVEETTKQNFPTSESWWIEYWEYRISLTPYFLEQAKLLYQDGAKILEIPTRQDLVRLEVYNLEKLKNRYNETKKSKS